MSCSARSAREAQRPPGLLSPWPRKASAQRPLLASRLSASGAATTAPCSARRASLRSTRSSKPVPPASPLRRRGVPLAPYPINVRAQFPDTDTTYILTVGSDVKIVQDTWIAQMVVRIFNQGASANSNQFQAQSDWYYNWQSSIDATLQVDGAPRYSVAPKMTPLANMLDAFNGSSQWPGRRWILTYQEQLGMAFQANVTLPDAPMEVVCTFRGMIPTSDMFVDMRNKDALCELERCGIVCSEQYSTRVCR